MLIRMLSLALVLLLAGVTGCATTTACDPTERQPYQDARSGAPLAEIEGIYSPGTSGRFAIRGEDPAGRHVTNPCLKQSPRIVPIPGSEEDEDD